MFSFLLKINVNNSWQKLLNNHFKKPIFWIKSILFLAIFFSFFIQCKVFLDPDLGWHLREGQRIYEGGEVYSPDEYTFTMTGYKWNNHEWLIQVFLWLLKSNNLWFLAEIIFTLLASLPLLFWIAKAKHYEELIFIYLGSVVLGDFVGIRPQIITFFLFSLTLIVLLWRFSDKWKEKYFPYYSAFFVLLFWFWANTHGGFFAALTLFSIFIFSNIIESWFKNRQFFYKYFFIDFVTIVLAFTFTFINPIGWLVYKEIFDVMSSSIPPDFIIEWRPFLDRLILSPSLFESLLKMFFVTFSTVCLIFSWKKIPLYLKLTFVFFLIMFLKTIRMGPFFIITAIPLIFFFLNDFRTILLGLKRKYLIYSSRRRAALWSLILILFLSFYFYSNSFFKNYEDLNFPKIATEYLKNEVSKGENIKLFNSYNWGGYLVYHIPEIKVFIDGRGPHWVSDNGYSAMEDYLKIINGEMVWNEIFNKYGINTVIIKSFAENNKKGREETNVFSFLKIIFIKFKVYFNIDNGYQKDSSNFYENIKKSGQWEIVFEDDIATIWKLKK